MKTTLTKLMKYYSGGRAVGHTHRMIEGVKNLSDSRGCIVMCASREQADLLAGQVNNPDVKFLTIGDTDKLTGLHAPMVIDHFALQVLIQENNEQYERIIDRLKRDLAKVSGEV